MSKKKPKKKPAPPAEIRDACKSIVSDLYREVSGEQIESLSHRIAAIEKRLSSGGCPRQEPRTWLGRMHQNRWFCLPWCRWFR